MSGPDDERIAALGADVAWSPQQLAHWTAERALDWSGLPVTHLRAAMFVENPILFAFPARAIAEESRLMLPFADGKTAPVATLDVVEVAAAILSAPEGHAGRSYALTGPERKDMYGFAEDFSAGLGRTITYVPISVEAWEEALHRRPISDHIKKHLKNLVLQNAGKRYVAEVTSDVEVLLGRPATRFVEVVRDNVHRFRARTG